MIAMGLDGLDRALADTDRPALRKARVPAVFLPDGMRNEPDDEGAVLVDIALAGGTIESIRPAAESGAGFDLDGRHLWPRLVDMHTHLDKSHVVDRALNRSFTVDEARDVTARDRRRWDAEDLRRRMTFSLRCAEAHGVGALRTHLDSPEEQAQTTWSVFAELRREWASRMRLQAVSLVPLPVYATAYGVALADLVAEHGGVLGGVSAVGHSDTEAGRALLTERLETMLTLARERGLDVDLHVDESDDVGAQTLSTIARVVLDTGFPGRVVCGHCCSLALHPPDRLAEILSEVRQAGLGIVSLPLPNMHLQDRSETRGPRWRGAAPVKDLVLAGIPVALAGDNCRDAWFSYGDGDMVDILRQSVRILHLDAMTDAALAMIGPVPARMTGLGEAGVGRLRPSGPADFIAFDARRLDHLLCRPQTERLVVRNGRALPRALPRYEELDGPAR